MNYITIIILLPPEHTYVHFISKISPGCNSKITLEYPNRVFLSFQTENGIKSTTFGYQKILPSGERGQAMHGKYSYTAPDGSTVNTSWTADEKGFRAQGPHISVFGLGFGRRR